MKLTFTDAEWIRIIDGECEDSLLPKCCANISQLRSDLISHVRDGRSDKVNPFYEQRIKRSLLWCLNGHDELPLFTRLIEMLGVTQEEIDIGHKLETPDMEGL